MQSSIVAVERNEWHDIGRADARMFALMLREIDAVPRHGHRRERRRHRRLERRDAGDHGAMVRDVAGDIEHVRARRVGYGVANRRDHRRDTAYGEIRRRETRKAG
jgi:hypothetical protein